MNFEWFSLYLRGGEGEWSLFIIYLCRTALLLVVVAIATVKRSLLLILLLLLLLLFLLLLPPLHLPGSPVSSLESLLQLWLNNCCCFQGMPQCLTQWQRRRLHCFACCIVFTVGSCSCCCSCCYCCSCCCCQLHSQCAFPFPFRAWFRVLCKHFNFFFLFCCILMFHVCLIAACYFNAFLLYVQGCKRKKGRGGSCIS